LKKRDYGLYLEDILKAINSIEDFVRDLTFNEFSKDKKTVDAVIRNLEIIGEASKHIPSDIRGKHREIPWKSMSGMRDIVIHKYFEVALDRVWKTVKERLPEVKSSVEKVLIEIDKIPE
jgi:uncharacterized protein with HEPN domain